ncbi:MAG: DUF262 domain-containing HNH endonuclease family protein [Gammaproteobacteria bacterium]|nr:DUF262 domain-containing HNH endonuclease family protein [Gammaproteobacteria bacterium]
MANPSTVIRAEAMLISELFHMGQFEVPWHQRHYDWAVSDVRALLSDIDDTIERDQKTYFLGAIMLIENGSEQWLINDGQQRMITISLVNAVLCNRFSHEKPGSQREGHALRLLFDLDDKGVWTLSDSDQYVPRISPPANDKMQYHQMIRGNTIGTNGLLTAAWDEINRFFDSMDIKRAEQYFQFLLRNLEVACLWVPLHIDANAVYETLNFRGKKLDDWDLIRNYLYSHFGSDSESEKKNSVHADLERIGIRIPNTKKASEYIRSCLQCKFGFLRKDQFYREAREAIRSQKGKVPTPDESLPDYVLDLTRQLALPESLELYLRITAANPEPDFIRAFEVASDTVNSRRNLAVFLYELRDYKVTLPLIFSILTWFIQEKDGRRKRRIARIAHKNLSRLATFVLRTAFVAPKFEPSNFEEKFSNYAYVIASAEDLPDTEFADFLRDCDQSAFGVLNDTRFRNAMNEISMSGSTKNKKFLLGINGYQQKDFRLLNPRQCSLEHVLPESPIHWSGWDGFSDDGINASDWVTRIGNLTLMGPTDNKPGVKYNSSFEKKRPSYQESAIKLTRDLGKLAEWSPDHIRKRQKRMATLAVKIWAFE